MNIEALITDLRARVNPQYYDQIGTESYERHQCVLALESLMARIDVLREENAALRADSARIDELVRENERLASDIARCYRMLLSEPDTQGALFKAENILRESLADRAK